MSYNAFAEFYDGLTGNVEYKDRAEYIEKLIKSFGREAGTTLDLACGTGSLTLELYRRGFDIFGVDASIDMLSEAQQKCSDDEQILFICQKMQRLNLASEIDTCICTLDSINHLTNPKDVKETFKRVAKYLSEGGLFIFDVNTIYKHREVLCDNCFVFDTDEVFCSWQNELDKETDIVNITLDFFIPDENGLYFRETEEFSERAYSDEDLIQWLSEAGLKILAVYDDMSFDEPKPESERKIFVAVNN